MDPKSPAAEGGQPRKRKWPRRVAYGLLGLLLLLLLLVGGALLYVNSSAGERKIRDLVVAGANDAIQGKLAWESLDVRGDRFIFKGLKLYDPEGVLVAEIDTVELELAFRALLRRRVIVREAKIFRPRLYLVQDERGLNLSRAIASKNPKQDEEDPNRSGEVFLKLDSLLLSEGYIDFEQQGADSDLHVQVKDLTAKGDATYNTAGQKIEANLDVGGMTMFPVQGPLSTVAKLKLEGMNGGGDLKVQLPGAVLDAHGDLKGLESAHLNLKQLDLSPDTVRAFVPSYPVKSPIALTGDAEKNGDQVKFDLDGHAAGGTLKAKGSADVKTMRSPGITVTARGLNLADLVEKAPQTELSLDLEAKGGGTSLETLDADVTLNVPPSKVEGEPLGPVAIEAHARNGRFEVPRFNAILPGVELKASGSGTLENLQAKGTLNVSDLSRMGKTLGRMGKADPPAVSGSGNLAFTVRGPAKSPGVTLQGQFESLRYATYALRGLSLDVNVPDVTQPLDSEGQLQVAYLSAAERVFRDVKASLQSKAQEFRLELVTGGAMDLHLLAVGTRDEDSRGLALTTLTLEYPEASWSLTQPARIAFRPEATSARGLQLRAQEQLLALDAELRGKNVDAHLRLEKFDLGKIPKFAVDPQLGLKGLVDADLTAKGPQKSPTAKGTVTLRQGAFKQYQNLGFTVDATYEKDRATGKLSADSDIADVTADFDIPVQGVLRRRKDEVKLSLHVAETDLAEAMKALGRPEPAQGKAGAQVVVTGTARDPILALRVWGKAVRYGEYPPPSVENADFDLRLESALEDRVNARVDVVALGLGGRIDVRTPFTLGQLIADPPSSEKAMATPIEVDLALQRVPLALLEAAGVRKLDGFAVVRAEMRGSVNAPTVNAEVAIHGAGIPEAPPVDGTLTLVATPERIDFGLEGRRGDRKLLELAAGIGAPIARLMEGGALGDIPLQMKGLLHPLSLAEFQPPPADEDARAKQASGVVLARWDASGTLDAPRLSLRSNLEEVRVGQACIGHAAIAYDYADTRSDLKVDLTSLGEGTLKLVATTKIPLGYSAVQKGVAYENAPITADLTARKFELGSFSGLIPKVRAISGLLEADAHVQGTVAKPAVKGDVEWKNGKLALEGYGDYSDAHVLVHASNDRIHLEDFKAKSGAGSIHLVADARRQGQSGTFALKGNAEASRFPIVYDDQLMAVLTSNITLDGEASSSRVYIRQLNIPEAHVDLPDILGGKDLQDLDRPEDVVFVRNGKPLKKRKAPPAPQAGTGGSPPASGAPAARIAVSELPDEEDSGPSTEYEINVNAPRNLWVKGADINAELGLSDSFKIEYREALAINGTVLFHRGDVDVLGRKFKVQKDSTVRFTGPAKTPYLNLTAVHVNDREDVTVTVNIRGQGKEVAQGFKVSSTPALPETEIYTLLATGRRTLKRGSGQSMNTGDAASIVGALAASTVKRALSNKLPLDVFTLESTGEGAGGAYIEAGTYITDKWYMGYTGRLGGAEEGENTYGVRVEYQVSPNVTVEGEYGDQRKGADLIWSRDY